MRKGGDNALQPEVPEEATNVPASAYRAMVRPAPTYGPGRTYRPNGGHAMFDRNPKATDADRFVAGKTTEAIVRALHAGTAPEGTLAALVARFDRKAERREAAAAA